MSSDQALSSALSHYLAKCPIVHPDTRARSDEKIDFSSDLLTRYTPNLDRARRIQDGLVMPVSAHMIRKWNKFAAKPRVHPRFLFECNRRPIESIVCKPEQTADPFWSRGIIFRSALPLAFLCHQDPS